MATKSAQNIIEVKHFKMVFADKTVIKDLSFEVKQGETFGLLGSNGCGKTTTAKLQPSAHYLAFMSQLPASFLLMVRNSRPDTTFALAIFRKNAAFTRKKTSSMLWFISVA